MIMESRFVEESPSAAVCGSFFPPVDDVLKLHPIGRHTRAFERGFARPNHLLARTKRRIQDWTSTQSLAKIRTLFIQSR